MRVCCIFAVRVVKKWYAYTYKRHIVLTQAAVARCMTSGVERVFVFELLPPRRGRSTNFPLASTSLCVRCTHTRVNYVLPCCCRGNRSGIAIAVVGHDPVGCFSTTFRLSTPTAARRHSRKSIRLFVFFSHRVNITAAAATFLITFDYFSFLFVQSVQRVFDVRV